MYKKREEIENEISSNKGNYLEYMSDYELATTVISIFSVIISFVSVVVSGLMLSMVKLLTKEANSIATAGLKIQQKNLEILMNDIRENFDKKIELKNKP